MFFGLLNKQAAGDDEARIDRALRPLSFDTFVGQKDLVQKLKIAIQAANARKDPVDHILVFGPPGLGKTTIAQIVANECQTGYKHINAPSIKTTADILEILTKLKSRDVLFIDEIHALEKKTEETLYSAMEDFKITIKLGNKDHVTVPIQPFCLIGATTNPGRMAAPLRDRFGLHYTMDFYSPEELSEIVGHNIPKLDLNIDDPTAILNIARRSRGTPRIANRLLRRVRDFAQLNSNSMVTNDVVEKALSLEGIDQYGLTKSDKRYLSAIYGVYGCGPVGLQAIAATIGEDTSTVENYIEGYLIRLGFIARTKTGRLLTSQGMEYIVGSNNP